MSRMSVSLDNPPKLAGKKRKRYMAVEEDPTIKLTGKLHHCLKEMRKAAKKSKTFETQRLVKRLKGLRKPNHIGPPPEGVKDLETQLESLKGTDNERIAYLALSSKIRKDKLLASNDALMSSLASAISTTANANTEATHKKVESRLLSSKILAAGAQEAVKGLRAVLEPGMTAMTHGGVRTLEVDDDEGRVGDEGTDGKVAVDAWARSRLADDDSSDEGDVRETTMLEKVVDEAEDMVDDGGWESGSIDGIEHADSDDDDESSSPPKTPKQPSSSDLGSLDPNSSAAASTFLPSLSVGYIKGDSESDDDPSDGETVTSGRKNRRGQRARQAIWEKKYGRNAKHLKKQHEDAQATATARSLGKRPDHGWDGRRHGGSESASVSIRGANKKRLAQKHSRDQQDRHPPSEKPTHPSWEAKRKLKEKEGARILPSQGKKIVFT